jgi:lysophospholipase L1-like esterase
LNTKDNVKRILCYGDSNTWGWVPGSMGKERFDTSTRYPSLLQKKLKKDYEVIEEGLGGRTTSFDDPRPEFPERNGLTTLPIVLESHLPLDYVILMLGTTDTKPLINKTPEEIGEGVRSLIRTIKQFRTLENTSSPKILLIVPPIVSEKAPFASTLFKGGEEKGRALINIYKTISEEENILFLDPTSKVKVDKAEGVHLDKRAHKKLAKMICEKIREK